MNKEPEGFANTKRRYAMELPEKLDELRKIVQGSDNIVFFGGAGVSTESNIPDFRSEQGLYKAKTKYGHEPEVMLSHTFFERRPNEFFDYHLHELTYPDAEPNDAHRALAKLEQMGKLKAVVTQNIDGLHQAAGSKRVWELHGSVLRNYCMRCGKSFPVEYIQDGQGVPKCNCGGTVKPDVVLYEESLDSRTLQGALKDIENADMLIIGGTSLAVYPAASLVNYYRGGRLALINKSPTPYDSHADLILAGPIGEILGQIKV